VIGLGKNQREPALRRPSWEILAGLRGGNAHNFKIFAMRALKSEEVARLGLRLDSQKPHIMTALRTALRALRGRRQTTFCRATVE
jgi:hypothetical protein